MKLRSAFVLAVSTALVAILAIGLVGCGGGGPMTEDEYKEKAGQAVKDLVASMEAFNAMEEPESIEDARKILGEKADEISKIKKTVDGFNPPDKYKETQETLKSAAAGIDTFFKDAKKAFDDADSMEAAEGAFEDLEGSFEDFMNAAMDLQTVAEELEVDLGTTTE